MGLDQPLRLRCSRPSPLRQPDPAARPHPLRARARLTSTAAAPTPASHPRPPGRLAHVRAPRPRSRAARAARSHARLASLLGRVSAELGHCFSPSSSLLALRSSGARAAEVLPVLAGKDLPHPSLGGSPFPLGLSHPKTPDGHPPLFSAWRARRPSRTPPFLLSRSLSLSIGTSRRVAALASASPFGSRNTRRQGPALSAPVASPKTSWPSPPLSRETSRNPLLPPPLAPVCDHEAETQLPPVSPSLNLRIASTFTLVFILLCLARLLVF
ncbi:hypothetical protein M5K25_012318 [Dendrobium thyrsiflorum]|uniref:Uncharacterized protein n=1 Tax=Dendrobium thyrsiflorum TaxID=117978 RepID=A0ABD0UWS6_DENTH